MSVGAMHSCAVTSRGAAWCWGENIWGALGDVTTTDRFRAVRVTRAGGGRLAGVTAVSAGGSFSCARTVDGAAWCWGHNEYASVGDGTRRDRHRAVRVTRAGGVPLAGITALTTGGVHACALVGRRVAWCWGDNRDGALGDGTTTDRLRAVRVRWP